MSKVRITVLVAANMCGTEKRKLFVIGKSANPRCFKNKILPVKYRANSKSWMTSNLFTEELLQWDAELQKKNRKILLLLDNCPAHPDVPLNQIKLLFMPPNTSSRLQPMDQGVIHSLQSHYRKIMLMKMLEAIDSGKEFSVSLLDAYFVYNVKIYALPNTYTYIKNFTVPFIVNLGYSEPNVSHFSSSLYPDYTVLLFFYYYLYLEFRKCNEI